MYKNHRLSSLTMTCISDGGPNYTLAFAFQKLVNTPKAATGVLIGQTLDFFVFSRDLANKAQNVEVIEESDIRPHEPNKIGDKIQNLSRWVTARVMSLKLPGGSVAVKRECIGRWKETGWWWDDECRSSRLRDRCDREELSCPYSIIEEVKKALRIRHRQLKLEQDTMNGVSVLRRSRNTDHMEAHALRKAFPMKDELTRRLHE